MEGKNEEASFDKDDGSGQLLGDRDQGHVVGFDYQKERRSRRDPVTSHHTQQVMCAGSSFPAAATAAADSPNNEQQMMMKYWRSKSLPVAYLPQPVIPSGSSPPKKIQVSEKSSLSETSSNPSSKGQSGMAMKKSRQIKGSGGNDCFSGAKETNKDGKKKSEWRTLQQNYYPEGGWGWVVTFCAFISHAISYGIQLYLSNAVNQRFQEGWLGAASVGVSLLFSPIWVSICKRKSTRLAAVFGGLVASLGCLFTSFAFEFHQLFLSYGGFIGVGVGLTRDASSLMVGQYFKRKRDLVEVIVLSGSGLGILLMSVSIHSAIRSFGWRLGLQVVTCSLLVTFFLGTCYRSASLYHPQRRAILHLKNQKRKVKEKEKRDDQPPFLDLTCLRSKTLQILLLSSAFTAFGINTPLFYMTIEMENDFRIREDVEIESKIPIEFSLVILHISIGISWIVGCFLFGLIVIQKNQECRVSKQYLCQIASVLCGFSIIALASTDGFNGLVIFSCVYGFSLGGYNYALKVYTYERVRARHFPRAWSFIQCAQAIPIMAGVPLTCYLNTNVGWKSGYYLSALSVIIGSTFLFLTDVRKRRLSRRKTLSSSTKTCETTTENSQTPKMRRLSFAFPIEQMSPQSKQESCTEGQPIVDPEILAQELTCISEEGIADMDFQDIYLEEWADYFGGDCITSCNKVENCLVSEFDVDYPTLVDRRNRRWSAARPSMLVHAGGTAAAVAGGIAGLGTLGQNLHATVGNTLHPLVNVVDHRIAMSAPREIPVFRNQSARGSRSSGPPRSITVIDEASV